MNKIIAFCTIALLVSACASRPSSIITSTSPLPPGVRGTIKTSASNCQYNLLGFIPVTTSPDTADALAEAKEDIDVDVLTDVTVDYNGGYYILFSNSCVEVSGLGVPRDMLREIIYPTESKTL